MRYLIRRILYSAFLLLGVSALTFGLVNLAPGEFFDDMRLDPNVSVATINGLRKQHGLDRPLPVRYVRWLRSAMQGDWGTSLAYGSPAAPLILRRARNTLLLTGSAMFCAWLIALPLGLWGAGRRNPFADLIVAGTVATFLAIPEIVLALLLLFLAVRSGRLPVGGAFSPNFEMLDTWQKVEDLARHLILPCLTLTLGFLPLLLTHVRAAVAQVTGASFLTAARAHGIPFRRRLWRHALPAAANPLISLFGFSVGILLSSSVLVEGIFGWPGLGQLLIQAILQRDMDLVVDSTVLATVFLILGNLLADGLLYAADPRIRADRMLA
jgi:peptide/nickel transport system permease protein